MGQGSFHPNFEDLPEVLPIFPLTGALLLPNSELPLNVFEPRYLNLTFDVLGRGRMMGMVQPRDGKDGGHPVLFETGCLGRISSFSETEDGRLLITLTGLCRFRILRELDSQRGYRRCVVDYAAFRSDLDENEDDEVRVDRGRLVRALKAYAKQHGMDLNWRAVEAAPAAGLMTALAMLCPFEPREKQALLEARTLQDRCDVVMALLEMAEFETPGGSQPSRQ